MRETRKYETVICEIGMGMGPSPGMGQGRAVHLLSSIQGPPELGVVNSERPVSVVGCFSLTSQHVWR